jgi:ubiquitin-activating enzyme E1
LKELNTYVNVSNYEGDINEEFLEQFDVVVFTEFFHKEALIKFNNFCRNRDKPIGFIWAGSLGLYGYTFVDFGPNFTVIDPNGEDPRTAIVSSITNESRAQVTTHEDKRHGFLDDDYVKFKEVEGMDEINSGQPCKIKVLSPIAFLIECDTTNFSKYVRNGLVEQVKMPTKVQFKSLESSLQAPLDKAFPPLENPDLDKWGRSDVLHIAFNGFLDFVTKNQRLPNLNDEGDASAVLELAEAFHKTPMDIEG